MSEEKPAVVEAVLGQLIEYSQVEECPENDILFAYPNGYGSPWTEGDEVNIHVTPKYPMYPTENVCQVRIKESVRGGYIIQQARRVDTTCKEIYSEWFTYE